VCKSPGQLVGAFFCVLCLTAFDDIYADRADLAGKLIFHQLSLKTLASTSGNGCLRDSNAF
jgi:hypothetical protein